MKYYPDLPGGAAFPSAPEADVQKSFVNEGMSLRDYFAAKAMQALIQKLDTCSQVARSSYAIADSMLEARK